MTTIMKMNCILTFGEATANGDIQGVLNIDILVSEKDHCWRELLDAQLFSEIAANCASTGWDVRQLVKISTCADWDTFERCTGEIGLIDHDGKWYFGRGRYDLDEWENVLMRQYGFGEDVNVSCVQEEEELKVFMARMLKYFRSVA
ncbi:hypothetical protein [Celeribacter sp.]|uniref:hypothetical protein n=1 Tax=Celeribacter sp. TaxID=1890673 RepID=UPI003A93840F